MTYFIKYWLPALLYAGLIFIGSSIPLPTAPVKVPQIDKVAHFFEYALLALLIYRACLASPQASLYKNRTSISVLTSVLYAFSDEFHQFFVPMRQMDFFDFLADSIGACCAIAIVSLIVKRRYKHGD